MAETSDPAIVALAKELDQMRRQIRALSRGSGAAFRSVELGDGQPKYYEPTSPTPISEVVNEDGIAVVKPVKPPVPPVPTQPIVESAIDGINVKWDGTFIGANRPQSLRYVEIHVSFDPDFEPRDSTQVGTMVSAFGGTVFVRRPPEEGSVWVGLTAVDIIGQESAMSSTAEGLPLPAGQVDEPQVPDDAPQVVAVPLGIGGILASWEPVPEATSYEVYVSTSPIIAFETTELLGEGPATSLAIGMLPNGSNLPYQPIYIRVRPKSEAGIGPASPEVTATPRKATTSDVAAEYVYAGQVSATQVTSGNLNAVVALLGELTVGATSGRRIVLNPTGGFQVIDSEGQTLVNFPTEPGTPNVFNGDGVFQGITALGRASFRGNDNEISRNSSFMLASGTTRPTNAPTIQLIPGQNIPNYVPANHMYLQADDVVQAGDWLYQIYNPTGNGGDYWNEDGLGGSGFLPAADRYIRGWKWKDGLAGQQFTLRLPLQLYRMYMAATACKFAVIGGNFVMVYRKYDVAANTHINRCVVFSTAGAIVSNPVTLAGFPTSAATNGAVKSLSVEPEGSNIAVFYNQPVSTTSGAETHRLAKQVYNPATGAKVGGEVLSAVYPAVGPVAVHHVGNYDRAGSRLPVTVQNTAAVGAPVTTRFLNPSTLTEYTAEISEFGSSIRLLWHSGESRFYAVGGAGFFSTITDPMVLLRHSKNTTEDYVWVAYSWYDSDPGGTGIHETTLSPYAYVQRKKYHVLSFYSTVQPADAGDVDSPDSARFYLATGASEPASEQAFRVITPIDDTFNYAIFDCTVDYLTSTTPPPVTNTFPDGSAGEIRSGIGGFIVRGDGTGDWPYLRDAIVEELGGGVPGGGGSIFVQPGEPTELDEGTLWFDEDEPNAAGGLPPGGSAGAALVKKSAANYDVDWDTGAWTYYTPTLYGGHVAGSGTLSARYRLLDPKTLQILICYNIAGTFTIPTQVVFGLPPGLTALVTNSRTQSIICRYYTSGTSQYVGFASTSTAIGSDRIACYATPPGAVLGSAQLGNGSNLDINGILELV